MIRIANKWYINRLDGVTFKMGSIIYWFTYLKRTFFYPSHTYGSDLPSASALGNTAQTRWSLRLLSFWKPVIGTFVKRALWATLRVSKRCFLLPWSFLYPAETLLKNLLPLKFIFEHLVRCNSFLLTTSQDHYNFYWKN